MKEDFVELEDLSAKLKKKRKKVRTWLDGMTFSKILIFWIFLIVIFGISYLLLGSQSDYLYYGLKNERIDNIFDAIYFSFVVATTTGLGDIIPMGLFKALAIMEVICGLLLLSFVTSKLVSIKQDIVLSELYEISFSEKLNRIRSTMILFRQNIAMIAEKAEERNIKKREANSLYLFISGFEDTLNDIESIMKKSAANEFAKKIDAVEAELIINSIILSVEKTHELIILLNKKRAEWHMDITVQLIGRCIKKGNDIISYCISSKMVSKASLANSKEKYREISELLLREIKARPNGKTTIQKYLATEYKNGDETELEIWE